MAENHLRNLVHRIAYSLEHDDDFDVDQALEVIEEAKSAIQKTYQNYQRACPPEVEEASECMADSAALFYGSLTALEEYIESCDPTFLERARTEVDHGSKLLNRALDWAVSVSNQNNPHELY